MKEVASLHVEYQFSAPKRFRDGPKVIHFIYIAENERRQSESKEL